MKGLPWQLTYYSLLQPRKFGASNDLPLHPVLAVACCGLHSCYRTYKALCGLDSVLSHRQFDVSNWTPVSRLCHARTRSMRPGCCTSVRCCFCALNHLCRLNKFIGRHPLFQALSSIPRLSAMDFSWFLNDSSKTNKTVEVAGSRWGRSAGEDVSL